MKQNLRCLFVNDTSSFQRKHVKVKTRSKLVEMCMCMYIVVLSLYDCYTFNSKCNMKFQTVHPLIGSMVSSLGIVIPLLSSLIYPVTSYMFYISFLLKRQTYSCMSSYVPYQRECEPEWMAILPFSSKFNYKI